MSRALAYGALEGALDVTAAPPPTAPRAALISLRHLLPTPPRSGNYEMEETFAEVDGAHIVPLARPAALPKALQRAASRLRRAVPRLRRVSLPGVACPLEQDYDLLVFLCQTPSDLYLLGPLEPWRRRARLTVCYLDEVWSWIVPDRAGEMELLAQFDYLFLGCEGSVEVVAEATRRPTFFLPAAVDALRFCPSPTAPPQRCIDIYNMGRRSIATHRALQRLAAQRGWFYLFSSVEGRTVIDAREHRLRLAALIQRTRYFLANRAKVTCPEQTGGQEEIGFRFFEGAAAGAILIGEAPRSASFERLFGWDGAVIPLPFGSAEVTEVIDALEADPERAARIRVENVANCLLRHDWSHRWGQLLHTVGLLPREPLRLRQARLEEQARKLRGDITPLSPRRTNGARATGALT